jgi:hypothetical protein
MNLEGKRLVGFSGHMTDAPDRPSPRFPESRVRTVRERVRAVLAKQGRPLHGVSSAARGGDLIFVEELVALGGTATVLLPFTATLFKKTSVGQGWDELFDRLSADPSVETLPPLSPEPPMSSDAQNAAFEVCNARIVEELAQRARAAKDPAPLFLAVFRPNEAKHVGGTWDAIERWRRLGHEVEIIDPLA